MGSLWSNLKFSVKVPKVLLSCSAELFKWDFWISPPETNADCSQFYKCLQMFQILRLEYKYYMLRDGKWENIIDSSINPDFRKKNLLLGNMNSVWYQIKNLRQICIIWSKWIGFRYHYQGIQTIHLKWQFSNGMEIKIIQCINEAGEITRERCLRITYAACGYR